MTPRWNSEDGKYEWWSDDTGWQVDALGNRVALTDAEIIQAQAKNQIPSGASEEAKKAVADALAGLGVTTDWRTKNPAKAAQLERWNANRPKGINEISDSEAELLASAYQYLGLTFEQSLDLYARYRYGEKGIPEPTAQGIKAWNDQFKTDEAKRRAAADLRGEVGVIRERAGLPPAAGAGGLPPGAEQTEVGKAILAVTNDPAVQAAMWHGATQEGGVEGPWGTVGEPHVGPDGEVGPWQIHPIHFEEIAPEAAADPNAAARYMLPRYQDGVRSVPAELWQTDPGGALVLAVANAEHPGGWHENLTVEEAVGIYGERATPTAGVAPGAGGLPAGPPVVPAVRRVLTPDEENDYTLNYAPRGVSRAAYVTAKDTGRNPLDVQNQINFTELNQALESKWITADEFNFALAYGLSLGDIRQMQTMGISQEEAAPGLVRGLTISDLGAARLLDVPVTDYIWARSRGLTDADIRDAVLSGQSVAEKVAQVKTTAAQGQAQAEFEDIWAKRTAGISEGILNVPGVTPALTREGARAQTEYVGRRTTELAMAALEQPAPGAAAKPEPLPSETGIPSTEELLTRVARGGVVPLYVEGREPLPGGFRPSERAVARTGPGGPPQAGGLGVLGPGGLYGFNPLGDWFAQQQMKAGFEKQAQEKQARTPEGEKYAQAYIGTLGPLTPKTEPLPGEEPKKKKEKLGLAAIS